jgi:hypothetical protein
MIACSMFAAADNKITEPSGGIQCLPEICTMPPLTNVNVGACASVSWGQSCTLR